MPEPGTPESVTTFFDGPDLSAIFERLLKMKEMGLSLEGSSHTYQPSELARLIIDAVKAADRADIEQVKSMPAGTNFLFVPAPDYWQLPEVRALTRTGGLRDAVLESRTHTTRLGPPGATPIGLTARRGFEELTGESL